MNIIYLWNRILKKIRASAISDSKIHQTAKIEAGSQVVHSVVGRYSFCGYDCNLLNCKIGSYCSIADNVIIGGAQHPISWVSTSPVFYAGRDSIKKKFSEHVREKDLETRIGNDVWIGEKALIKSGIEIGDGAVVGMGAVVVHNVLPYEIVGGVPAKHIAFRFEDSMINSLLASEWWNLPDNKIEQLAVYIKDPVNFLKELELCE